MWQDSQDSPGLLFPFLRSKTEEQYQERRGYMVGYPTKDNHLLWDLLPDWQCLASSWHASWCSPTIWFLRASTRTSHAALVLAAPFNHSFSISRRHFSGSLNRLSMPSSLATGTFSRRPMLYHSVLEHKVSSSTSPRSSSCNPWVNQVYYFISFFFKSWSLLIYLILSC